MLAGIYIVLFFITVLLFYVIGVATNDKYDKVLSPLFFGLLAFGASHLVAAAAIPARISSLSIATVQEIDGVPLIVAESPYGPVVLDVNGFFGKQLKQGDLVTVIQYEQGPYLGLYFEIRNNYLIYEEANGKSG
jgi:hypothetical protein